MRRALVVVLVGVLAIVSCGPRLALKPPAVGVSAIELPEKYNTPDGMVVDGDGNILLCVPNSNDDRHGAKILKIDKDDQIAEVVALPMHPVTKKPCGPLGIDIGSDGHLYVADNQSSATSERQSRLLRVVMRGGKAQKVEVVVTGFIMSNAVCCRGDYVYVTESKLSADKTPPMRSGVYCFRISELKGEAPIKLKPDGKDPHLIAKLETQNMDWVGANGMGFDRDGNMYVCNFGDAQLEKFTFDKNGKVASHTVVAKGQGMKCCDGMKVHPKTGEVYIADFLGNAVHKVDPKRGVVTTIARNGNTNGAGGLLDRPSEPCIRGNKVYVANIDLPLAGNTYDKPHTITVITLSH